MGSRLSSPKRPDNRDLGCGAGLALGVAWVLTIAVLARIAHSYGGPPAAVFTAVVLGLGTVLAIAASVSRSAP